MTAKSLAALRRAAIAAAPLALGLAGCGGDGNGDVAPVAVVPAPAPAPAPSPTPTPAASRNVTACLQQAIGNTGLTPQTLVIPDTLKLNFNLPNGFPNGRQFDDPVIDLTLAVLLLDLTRHSPATLVGVLNPRSDNTLLSAFPFIGLANGTQPTPGTGTTFNFRTDPASSYVRVDRMGNPAVATALIGTSLKNAYNDINPADDIAGTFVGGADGIVNQLTILHNALFDDLQAAGLTPCSTP